MSWICILVVLILAAVAVWNLGGREALREQHYRLSARVLGTKARATIKFDHWLEKGSSPSTRRSGGRR